MNDLLSNLTGNQALEVLGRLMLKKSAMAKVIKAGTKRVLSAVDIDKVADEVFAALDMIDVQDCWDRAGRHRDGYVLLVGQPEPDLPLGNPGR